MKSLLSFTIESFLLLQASLLQYAVFTSAQQQNQNNLSSSLTSPTVCSGCAFAALETTLTYPEIVKQVTKEQSITIIPYVTVYEDGNNITNWSTYTNYKPGQGQQTGIYTDDTPVLTWEALGTTLTYPTTYVAFPKVYAGANRLTTPVSTARCTASLTSLQLDQSETIALIFPSGAGAIESARNYIKQLDDFSSAVAPNNPATCTPVTLATPGATSTSNPEAPGGIDATTTKAAFPIQLTSVLYLTTQGQAVITRAPGTAPPALPNQGPTPPPPSKPNAGETARPTGTTTKPGLNWGGSQVTPGPSGVYDVGGTKVTAGGGAQVIDGTTVRIPSGGSVVVVDGRTSSLAVGGSGIATADGGAVGFRGVEWAGGVMGVVGVVVGVWL